MPIRSFDIIDAMSPRKRWPNWRRIAAFVAFLVVGAFVVVQGISAQRALWVIQVEATNVSGIGFVQDADQIKLVDKSAHQNAADFVRCNKLFTFRLDTTGFSQPQIVVTTWGGNVVMRRTVVLHRKE